MAVARRGPLHSRTFGRFPFSRRGVLTINRFLRLHTSPIRARVPRAIAIVFMVLLALWWLSDPAQAQDRAAADAAASGPTMSPKESFLSWMVRASGPIGLLILVLSFYLVALVVWMFLNFRRSVAIPGRLVRELNELLGRKEYTEAQSRLAYESSFLGRVLLAGVRKLPSGYTSALKALELANEDVTMEMEHRTTYLATVGTLGPMIGLVGTVYGMIMSFRVIAVAGASPQASQLAAGISTALFATLEGVALSIPAIYFYAMMRNRIARVSLEVAMAAESLLEQFAQGVRTPHPLSTGGVVPGGGGSARPSLNPPPAGPRGD